MQNILKYEIIQFTFYLSLILAPQPQTFQVLVQPSQQAAPQPVQPAPAPVSYFLQYLFN